VHVFGQREEIRATKENLDWHKKSINAQKGFIFACEVKVRATVQLNLFMHKDFAAMMLKHQ